MDGVAEFLGERRVPGFVMYNLGRYPAVVPGKGELVGELYRVPDPQTLHVLDHAEGVFDDPPLYARVQIQLDDGPVWLYQYERSVDGCQRIPSGDWTQR